MLLNWATAMREAHTWLIALLPVAGLASGLLYYYFGQSVDAGNDLIVEQIHADADAARSKIPFRMTPLILFATTLTHLFGGSVGREGTAVQTGASLADQIDRILSRVSWLTLSRENRRTLLIAGISSVFDTPLAGAVSASKFSPSARSATTSSFPAFWRHLPETTPPPGTSTTRFTASAKWFRSPLSPCFWLRLRVSSSASPPSSFAGTTHAVSTFFKQRIAYPPLRPFIEGILIALAVLLPGVARTGKYIGLGLPTIAAAFTQQLPTYDFAGKLAFTSLTLGSGFKGGEVTPLFYIGATRSRTSFPCLHRCWLPWALSPSSRARLIRL